MGSSTPEGKVKLRVKRLLNKYEARYEFWPVPSGYGASSLDCILCYRGRFVAIEVKKPGGKPTDRQHMTIRQIVASDGIVFVIDGDNGELEKLEEWLKSHALCQSRNKTPET